MPHKFWNPFLTKRIDQLEHVQRFALNVCFKQWNHNVSYHDLLQLAALPNLAAHRKYLNLCYFYKVVHNIFDFPNSPLTARTLNYPNRNGRTDLYVQPHANSNIFHYSYFPTTITSWNSLPPNVTAATTVSSFKTRLRNVIFNCCLL